MVLPGAHRAGMCYKYDSTNRTWTESLYSCNELSTPKIWSTLASVHDNETNEFLTNLTGGSEWTWVGGYLGDDDLWYWVDGSKWTGYNNWGPGQPDNLWGNDDHLGLNYPGTGHWNDFGGDWPQGSICQYVHVCNPGYTYLEHTGMCYKYNPTNRTWFDALESCFFEGSTLASVHDNATNDFLTSLTGGSEWTWVGGYQEGDQWYWSDGSEWTGYNNWGPGQPDNLWGKDDHLGLNYPGTGHWNDFGGDWPQGSICQYDPSEYAVTTSAPAYTCAPAGTQCTKSGFDFTGFEDVLCCHGYVCTPGVGVPTSTSNPFYCNPSEGYESTSEPTSCALSLLSAGIQRWVLLQV